MSGVDRKTAAVTVAVTWSDKEGVEWDGLNPDVRNAVRDHADAICDLVNLAIEARRDQATDRNQTSEDVR